jgi:hypothetical protein
VLQSAVHNIFIWDGEVTRGWKKLLNDIHNLKLLPFFVIMGIKSRKVCNKFRTDEKFIKNVK